MTSTTLERIARTTAKFWDKHAEKYSKQPIADPESYGRKLEITRRYFRPDTRVLELGCGTGSTAILHAPHVRHIRAIDCSPKMLDIAREKATAANMHNVTFEQGTVEAFEPGDERYDVVLALSILHLLRDKRRVVAAVYRALEPGGIFVTSTPALQDDMRYLKLIMPLGRMLGAIPPLDFFTKSQLLECFTEAGFRIEQEWQPGKGKAVFVVARKPE